MAIKRRVILSAGHAPGTGSVGGGSDEYTQTTDIVNKTVNLLKKDGRITVSVVPPALEVVDAVHWVNAKFKNINDGVAIEVHKNNFWNRFAKGLETWYGDPETTSEVIAKKLHTKLVSISGLKDRGIKTYTKAPEGGLMWISQTNTWALLPEMGFMKSDHMNNALYAKALYTGILNIWGLKPKVVKPPKPPAPVDPCKAEKATSAKLRGVNKVLTKNLEELTNSYDKSQKKLVETETKLNFANIMLIECQSKPTQNPCEVVRGMSWYDMFKCKIRR